MKKNNFILAAAATLLSVNLMGQTATTSTAYFTDGYVYKHKLNPALVPNMNYISMPVLNPGISTSGNIAVNDLFLMRNGSMTNILNKSVSYSDAIVHLPAMSNLNSNIDLNMLSVGFFNSKGTIFTNVELGVRVNAYTNLPKDVFAFAKGPEHPTSSIAYDMSGMNVSANAYTQIAVGQSYKVAEKFRIGYKLRLLMSAGNAEMNFEKFNANYSNNIWTVSSSGEISTEPICFDTKTSEFTPGKQVLDLGKVKTPDGNIIVGQWIGNIGFSADLGFTYDILDWVQVSASVQDLGFLTFKNQNRGISNQNVTSAGNNTEKFFKDLGKLADFEPVEGISKRTEMMPFILRGGAQVRIPTYKQISFGLLVTGQVHDRYSWWETRASFNYDVVRWFSFSTSYAYGTFRHQVGAVVNFHLKGFNFYLGADNIPFRYSVQGVPVSTSTTTLNVGINFLFGRYFGRYSK